MKVVFEQIMCGIVVLSQRQTVTFLHRNNVYFAAGLA